MQFEPETIAILDRCLAAAMRDAQVLEPNGDTDDHRRRIASALIEAVRDGEQEEKQLLEFALRVLPAYRERGARALAAGGSEAL